MAEETPSPGSIVRDGVTSSTLLLAHVTARSNMGTLQKTRLTVSLIVSYLKRDVYSCVSRISCHSCELMVDILDGGKQLQGLRDFNDDVSSDILHVKV